VAYYVRRTLRLVADHADEWTCVALTPEACRAKRDILERHCVEVGRDQAAIRRPTTIIGAMGQSEAEVERALGKLPGASPALSTPSGAARRRGGAGRHNGGGHRPARPPGGGVVVAVQLQHLHFDSDEVLEFITAEIAPRVAALERGVAPPARMIEA